MDITLTTGLATAGHTEARNPATSKVVSSGAGFEVDTGPPRPGAPPPIAAGAQQKEVLANEPKPQAEILDLLEQILPVDLTTLVTKGGRPAPEKPSDASELGVRLGDLKATIRSRPDAVDLQAVLQALGVKLPADVLAGDLTTIKQSIADQIVTQGLPGNLRGLLATVLAAVGDTLTEKGTKPINSSEGQPQQIVGGEESELAPGETDPLLSVRGDKPELKSGGLRPQLYSGGRKPLLFVGGTRLETQVVGPPRVVPTLSNTGVMPRPGREPIGPPIVVGLGETLPLGRPDPYNGDGMRLDAPEVRTGAGAVERQVVDALKITGLSVKDSAVGPIPTPLTIGQAINPAVREATKPPSQSLAEEVIPVVEAATLAVGGKRSVEEPDQPASPEEASAASIDAKTAIVKKPTTRASKQALALGAEQPELQRPEGETVQTFAKVADGKHATRVDHSVETVQVTDPQRAEIHARIADEIQQIAAARGNGRVTIHLSPEDLGTITLVVKAFGDSIDAKLTASDERVRSALSHHRPDLVQSIEGRGLSLSNLSVGQEGGQDARAGHNTGHGTNHDQTTKQDFDRAASFASTRQESTTHQPASAPFFRGKPRGIDTLA